MKLTLSFLAAALILLPSCRSTNSSTAKDSVVAGANKRPGLHLTCTEGYAALSLRRIPIHETHYHANYELRFYSSVDDTDKGKEFVKHFIGTEKRSKDNERVEQVTLAGIQLSSEKKGPVKTESLGTFSSTMQKNNRMLDLKLKDNRDRTWIFSAYPAAGFEKSPEPQIDAHVERGKDRFEFVDCLIVDMHVLEQDK